MNSIHYSRHFFIGISISQDQNVPFLVMYPKQVLTLFFFYMFVFWQMWYHIDPVVFQSPKCFLYSQIKSPFRPLYLYKFYVYDSVGKNRVLPAQFHLTLFSYIIHLHMHSTIQKKKNYFKDHKISYQLAMGLT